MVERFHRHLKTALRAVEDPGNWSVNLPLALLGIRAALKSDLGCSAAELVFGTTLRLPGEMITPTSRGSDETPDNLVHRLRQFMRSLSPVPPRAPMTESYVEKDLDKCTHVFVRCDRVRQPLESPYEGPFRVLTRNTETCRILRGDKEDVWNRQDYHPVHFEFHMSLKLWQFQAEAWLTFGDSEDISVIYLGVVRDYDA
nr:unnamed protein product [Spirometra erinaceieuropaei]